MTEKRRIRVMRLWDTGAVTIAGLFTTTDWAWKAIHATMRRNGRLWIEYEKHPATKIGHS